MSCDELRADTGHLLSANVFIAAVFIWAVNVAESADVNEGSTVGALNHSHTGDFVFSR